MTFQLVVRCLNQLYHCVPLCHWYKAYWSSRGKCGMHTHGRAHACTELCNPDLKFLHHSVSCSRVFLELLIHLPNSSDRCLLSFWSNLWYLYFGQHCSLELLWQIVIPRLQHCLFCVALFGELLMSLIQIQCVYHCTVLVVIVALYSSGVCNWLLPVCSHLVIVVFLGRSTAFCYNFCTSFITFW